MKSDVTGFTKMAEGLGIALFPWQKQAARYLTARNAKGNPLYREVAIVVARQNGKTTLLKPLVLKALLDGRRVMHAAQNLKLPGLFHEELAALVEDRYHSLLPARRGISWRAGQESIRLTTGGFYQIVAATGSAPRGPSNDLVIIDEIRELTDDRFYNAIKSTTIARKDGQLVYLSNAGFADSVVLNALRARSGQDTTLAYVEWSAAPERTPDDEAGWLEANPSIGYIDGLLENLRAEYHAALLGGLMSGFETENLCRTTIERRELLVKAEEWTAQTFEALERPVRSNVAVKMDISGERAGAVAAWQLPDKRLALVVLADVSGSPVDINRLGPALVMKAREWRASEVAFDPYTDADLARHFRVSKPVFGRDYANASEAFVRRARNREFVVADPEGRIASDLERTVRKASANGAYVAAKAGDGANAVAEAAIRAAWRASKPGGAGLMALG